MLPGLLGYRLRLAQQVVFRDFAKSVAELSPGRVGILLLIDANPGVTQSRLAEAATAGHCRFGLHRQNSALMTCIVPSPFTRDHMHFIDGASGGYAMAARNLKASYSN